MKYLTVMIVALMAAACSPKKQQTEEKPPADLKTQVMAVHDEVMPKMGELRTTQKELLAMADSSATDSVMAAKYQELATQIELANESMMDWMRKFNPNFEGSEEEVKAYLQDQLKGIKKVSDDMNNSLKAGREALED
ncbi:hypothetical protein [Marinoscillum furvescens]|uniref:Viral A-type inclusion protein n=1 Tax=Marinoscillum furvescens DSM 4134 TaxID=1122208 RepID=A0A3D9L4L7_MARFU|nr:hypothetical protein [Marinoscillum furvescens]RED99432.1 hypothetical protein C7460_10848 [Marinoscillum furvescens DSM 4134]